MLRSTNSSLSNIVLMATLSASVVSLGHEAEGYLTPQKEATYTQHAADIANWRDNAFSAPYDSSLHLEDYDKVMTMINFTTNLLNNTENIDSEFVDIVNDNFWDLI